LSRNGAKVYIVGRTEEKLEKVAEVYGKDIPGKIIPISADISKKVDIKNLVSEIESKEKCLCILINNAGISSNNQMPTGENAEEFRKNLFDPEDATFEEWEQTYRTNVPQIYFMTAAFLPLLHKATEHQHGYSGTVINIGSISGMTNRSQNHFAYNASKGAAHHLTKMLASEISNAGLKIRINCIAPGVFPSEMTAKESDENQKSHLPKDKKQDLPSQRPGSDRDMASAILFTATNQYLNGQISEFDSVQIYSVQC
jgi:NAD(P)-dependent dehydrogenase (short-subunit alcohol dehydrogenase family)